MEHSLFGWAIWVYRANSLIIREDTGNFTYLSNFSNTMIWKSFVLTELSREIP